MIARLPNIALGIWLMVAPAVLGFASTDDAAGELHRTVGPLIVSAAIIAIWPEVRPVRRVNTLLGGVMVLVPVVLLLVRDHPVAATVNGVVVGVLVIAASLVRGTIDARFGGGWRSVWRPDIDTVDG